jgi:hypothetical protein
LKYIFEYGDKNEKNNENENEKCWLPLRLNNIQNQKNLNIIDKNNDNNKGDMNSILDSKVKNTEKRGHKEVPKKVFLFIIDAIRYICIFIYVYVHVCTFKVI